MSIKSPKNNNNIIKDISKSRLNINWNTNPSFNLYLPPLQNCRDKKNIFTDSSSNNVSCKRNLKTNDYSLNMTINNILDKMEKKRKDNKSSVDSFFKITNSLDKTTDISNTQIIKYDSKTKPKSFDDFFTDISKKNSSLENKSSLFRYSDDKFNTRYNAPVWSYARTKKRSMYFTPPSKLTLPPPAPIIEKKKVNIEVEIDGLDDILKLIEDYP